METILNNETINGCIATVQKLLEGRAWRSPTTVQTTQELFDRVAWSVTVGSGKPVGACYCGACEWFDMTGYDEQNVGKEFELCDGWCMVYKGERQRCDFCSKGEKR